MQRPGPFFTNESNYFSKVHHKEILFHIIKTAFLWHVTHRKIMLQVKFRQLVAVLRLMARTRRNIRDAPEHNDSDPKRRSLGSLDKSCNTSTSFGHPIRYKIDIPCLESRFFSFEGLGNSALFPVAHQWGHGRICSICAYSLRKTQIRFYVTS